MPLFGPEASKASASAWSIGRKRGTKHAPLDVSKGYDVDWQAVGKELGDLFTSVSTMATQVGTSQPPPAKSKSAARAPWRKKKGAEAEATGDIVSTALQLVQTLIGRFSQLPARTQVTVSWTLLSLSILCISGLWTIKIACFILLLLFKPMGTEDATGKGKTAKKAKKQKSATGDPFSDDPLISALQRIPDTFTYGNVAPGASSKGSMKRSVSTPEGTIRRMHALSPPPLPMSVIRQAAKDEAADTKALPEAPSEVSTAGRPVGLRRSPASLPAPLPPPKEAQSTIGPAPVRLVDQQTNSDTSMPQQAGLGPNGWQKGPSGSFHRIEVAKKAWKRNFSSSTEQSPSPSPLHPADTAVLPEMPVAPIVMS